MHPHHPYIKRRSRRNGAGTQPLFASMAIKKSISSHVPTSSFSSFGPKCAVTSCSILKHSMNFHPQFHVASCLKSALDRKTVSSLSLIIHCNAPRSGCKDETRAMLHNVEYSEALCSSAPQISLRQRYLQKYENPFRRTVGLSNESGARLIDSLHYSHVSSIFLIIDCSVGFQSAAATLSLSANCLLTSSAVV